VFGDIRRWRSPVTTVGMGLAIAAHADTLALTVSDAPMLGGQRPDLRAFVVDAPAPLPGILAGPAPSGWLAGNPTLDPFGVASVPVRIAGTAPVLPVVAGHGILVDLQSAVRDAGTGGGTFQVWLAPDAPQSTVDSLRSAGLTVLREDSVPRETARLGRQGPAVTRRFALLAGVLGLLLAAATATVGAAVERAPRAAELVDLRVQGLPRTVVRAVTTRGYAVLLGLGILAGLGTTVLGYALADVRLPMFVDGWAVLPAPAGPQPVALAAVVLAGLVLLGLPAAVSGSALAREAGG
jgi:hypothetical protein